MRLYSAYISRRAAQDANSVFEAEHTVQKINRDGADLWKLVRREVQDESDLDRAERDSQIEDIEREEQEELKDIEDVVNKTFRVIRDSVLVIHTQLDELKRLVREDEVLRDSGFPIEVAEQLEKMLNQEIINITAHLRQMGEEIKDDNLKAQDPSRVDD